MRHSVGVAIAAIAAVVSVGGCAGSSGSTTGGPTAPTITQPLTPQCPSTSAPPGRWPRYLPPDFPRPAAYHFEQSTVDAQGIRTTRFTTSSSMRDAVLFVVQRFPRAGYVLGRGDAEATEADAPFVHGPARGLLRLAAIQNCMTLWLLYTVDKKVGPVPNLPTFIPSASPSPLPFG
ncbi:MAG: hypothetical protein JO222_15605 [Frankiales bacterium]|nr:hypothetical protein [Frankiales bacterium]